MIHPLRLRPRPASPSTEIWRSSRAAGASRSPRRRGSISSVDKDVSVTVGACNVSAASGSVVLDQLTYLGAAVTCVRKSRKSTRRAPDDSRAMGRGRWTWQRTQVEENHSFHGSPVFLRQTALSCGASSLAADWTCGDTARQCAYALPPGWRHCVRSAGIRECAAPSEYTERFVVYPRAVIDSRTCAPCTCSAWGGTCLRVVPPLPGRHVLDPAPDRCGLQLRRDPQVHRPDPAGTCDRRQGDRRELHSGGLQGGRRLCRRGSHTR